MEKIDSVSADSLDSGDFILAENGVSIAEIVAIEDLGDSILVILENDDEIPFTPHSRVDIFGYPAIVI